MRQEFRGDLQLMREQVYAVGELPFKHVDELIGSLGLSDEQLALIGSRLLRGDLSGLLQQVLAPLAYSADDEISVEDTTPIFIRSAKINGSLLPSAAGLTVSGKLPLRNMELAGTDELEILMLQTLANVDGRSVRISGI